MFLWFLLLPLSIFSYHSFHFHSLHCFPNVNNFVFSLISNSFFLIFISTLLFIFMYICISIYQRCKSNNVHMYHFYLFFMFYLIWFLLCLNVVFRVLDLDLSLSQVSSDVANAILFCFNFMYLLLFHQFCLIILCQLFFFSSSFLPPSHPPLLYQIYILFLRLLQHFSF